MTAGALALSSLALNTNNNAGNTNNTYDSDKKAPTSVVLALIPVAAAGVMISKKRK